MKNRLASTTVVFCCWLCLATAQAAFVHPGCLSTQADLDRMAAKVAANAQPWKGSWDILVSNTNNMTGHTPEAVSTVIAGSCASGGENFMRLARDAARAYQLALRYHGDGSTWAANKAVEIMNAWAATHTEWCGDTNVSLRAGLYGYQLACAGELMRGYSGWSTADFNTFKQYMRDRFYSVNNYFLTEKHGTVDSHYWANWCHSNVASMMAIGVLCDDQAIFDDAVNYVLSGPGNESMANVVPFVHPNGLGQFQESGRDQGHTVMGPQLLGTICEIAWNQGVDLYGYLGNRFLASVEYISQYNLWSDVPWVAYPYVSGHPGRTNTWFQATISAAGRGAIRPGWDLVYHHYVNRLGMSAPWTGKYAEKARPEGGGGNYGGNSGGYDGLGFTTLTHSRDPIAAGTAPGHLRPFVEGRQVTLSWSGSAYAVSYNVKRSTTSNGPYSTLAAVADTYYVDAGLTAGTTYYYVVSANNPGGEGANSDEVAVTADGQLHGTIIGTDGSHNDSGATKQWVFDGALFNYFDAPSSVAWAGLDLGAGVSAVITQIKYCPRPGYPGRMVGGKFQGSNTADFSSGVVDLYTVSNAPADGELTSQTVSHGTAFRYVRYLCPSGGYGNVAEVQFHGNISGLAAPAAPAGLQVSLLNGNQADLTWNAVAGATSYNVKRALVTGGPYTIAANVADTAFSDTALDVDTTCFYVVSALNSMGQSADSGQVSITTPSTGPGLTAYYKWEANTQDSSGNGYHAAAAGTPVYTTGQAGQAVDLDGVDDFMTLPPGVADTDDITVAAWVHWDGGGTWQRIFDFGSNTSRNFFLTPRSGGNTLRCAIKNGGSEQLVETSQLAVGQWVHVAVTLGGTTAKLYVDGILKKTNSSMTINPSDFNPTVNYIGDSQWSADPLFDGRIDDFRIYNYALDATAIAQLAQTQTDMDDLSGLAMWWLWLVDDCAREDECLTMDINGDGIINLDDFAARAEKWL